MRVKYFHRFVQSGFSLLEMLVALAILSMTLGILYQTIAGATRNVRTDERYVFGVELARSLLVEYGQLPQEGGNWRGETEGGFAWRVDAEPIDIPGGVLFPGALQKIDVSVAWTDGRRQGNFSLSSIVEGLPPRNYTREIVP